MANLMIKCPNTGRNISTGIITDRSRFASTPVFFSRTFCPTCQTHHEWFAKDAWLCEYAPEAMRMPEPDVSPGMGVIAAHALRARGRGRRS